MPFSINKNAPRPHKPAVWCRISPCFPQRTVILPHDNLTRHHFTCLGRHLNSRRAVSLLRRDRTYRLANRHSSSRCSDNIALTAVLDFLAVDARGETAVVGAGADLVAPLVKHVFDIEGVDVAGEVAGSTVSVELDAWDLNYGV